MNSILEAGQTAYQSVSTSVLRVFGASGWTGADSGAGQQRIVTLCTCSGAAVFVQSIDQAAALAGAVSATDYLVSLAAGQTAVLRLAAGQSLAVISAGTSVVRASEVVEVA
ncbi:MAG: hypothetical protein JSS65_03845 [Armatimonadetes bacterium]|nr:hypothetical protein [Armatimonadota bacterium]